MFDCISENLRGAIDELAPLKTVTPKKKKASLDRRGVAITDLQTKRVAQAIRQG